METITFITNPLFYLVAIPAVISIGISKAGIGGTGSLATPLMALVVAVPQAAALLLPCICVADIFAIWAFRKTWDKKNLVIMIPGATVGVVVGTLSFKYLDPSIIKLIIGMIAVVFSSLKFLDFVRRKKAPPPAGPKIIKGGFWCAVCGFTSFVAHSGGPPLNVYMIPQRLDKTVYMGTLAIFYTYVNYAKIIPYWWLEQFHITNLSTSLILLPVVPVGIFIGLWIQKRIDDVLFYRAVMTLLFVTGVKLLYDGVIGLV
ncbi:MAG: sulfite exporter TauE/SafE family protein [Pseudomonadota bacterium]|nr:sulfite exporter TauE/SafE family protein [Pseudomonadota bacterium]